MSKFALSDVNPNLFFGKKIVASSHHDGKAKKRLIRKEKKAY